MVKDTRAGFRIVYEDRDLAVVFKPAGMASQSVKTFEPDAVSELRKRTGSAYIGVVHRLDKPVSGLLVYAKTKSMAAALSAALTQGRIKKEYVAVVGGGFIEEQGVFRDFLKKEEKNNFSVLTGPQDAQGKEACLSYHVRAQAERPEGTVSLVDILLLTGRHHQIRVQFAAHGHPVVGDVKYAGNESVHSEHVPLALCARALTFEHPIKKKRMVFCCEPREGAFGWF